MESLEQIKRISEKKKKLEEKFEGDMKDLKQYQESIKSGILERELGLSLGDEVTLCIEEHRDDRVSCFATKQEAQCFITGVEVREDREKGEIFIAPILKKKDRKKPIYHNWYLTWSLKKDGIIVLSHEAEQHIIPGKYSDEKLHEIRTRLSQAQKI